MNWDRIEGSWKQVGGQVREQWDRLTDDHLERIAGKRDQLVGSIQESYGIARDEAERQVMAWEMRNAFLATEHTGFARRPDQALTRTSNFARSMK